MALISCPGCGKMISEKAVKCVNCGYALKEENEVVERNCKECGAILSDDATNCSNCGCPVGDEKADQVEVAGVKVSKKRKRMLKIISIAALILCVIGIGTVAFFKINDNKKKIEEYNSYVDNVNSACDKMLSSASSSENLCNLTESVWHNAIYKKDDNATNKYTKKASTSYRGTQYYSFVDDFNDALENLFSDSDIKKKISAIEDSQSSVNDLMKKLQNPPESLNDCYDAIFELNDVYNGLVSLATAPSGSYSTYSADVTSKVNEFKNKYTNMKNKIPEKKGTKE